MTIWLGFRGKFGRDSRVNPPEYIFRGVSEMSYFNDELRDVMGSIKNGQSASGLDFFIELKRKINNGYELYSEFNLRLIFSDITLQNEFSSLLSTIKLERIILRSILKNKDKKITIDDLITNIFESNNLLDFHTYIRGGEFYSGTGSVVGRQVKVGKTVGVQRGAGPMAMEDDGDRKIRDLKKKYKKFYRKFSVGQKSTNNIFSIITDLYPVIKVIIAGFLGYYVVSNKDELYQYAVNKYEQFSSFKSENFDKYFNEKNDLDAEITDEISGSLFSKIKNADEVISCKISEQFGGEYRRILVKKYLSCNVLVDKLNLENFELNRGNCSVSENSKIKTTGTYNFGDSINIEIYDFLRNERRRVMKIFRPNSTEAEISEEIKNNKNNILYDVDYDGQTNCNLIEARFVIDSDTYIYKVN